MQLILARENEIRKGHQRPTVLTVGVSVETSFRTTGIILSEFARAPEGSGVLNQGDERFWTDGIKFLFFYDLDDEISSVAVAVFHRVDEGQRDFAFFQIAKHGLSKLLCRGSKIQQIIDQLKGQTGVAAVICESLFFFSFESGQDRSEPGTSAEEARGFIGSQTHGVIFGDINAADLFELNELAFHHFLREIDQHIEDAEISLFQRHLEGLHVEPVASQNAAVIAPSGIRGRTPAAGVCTIDYIVVNQRGAMEKLHDRSQANCTGAACACIAIAKHKQRRSQPFAATAQKVAGYFRNGFECGSTLP